MGVPDKVVLHPLVLLSVVDHYNRVARDTRKRVVGLLLGDTYKGTVDVSNSFALPFEEDEQDPTIWFLDHSYLENMFHMFKKVNGERSGAGGAAYGRRDLRPRAAARAAPARPRPARLPGQPGSCRVLHTAVPPTPEVATALETRLTHRRQPPQTTRHHPSPPRRPQPRQHASVSLAGIARGRGCARRTWTSTRSWPTTATAPCWSSARSRCGGCPHTCAPAATRQRRPHGDAGRRAGCAQWPPGGRRRCGRSTGAHAVQLRGVGCNRAPDRRPPARPLCARLSPAAQGYWAALHRILLGQRSARGAARAQPPSSLVAWRGLRPVEP